MSVMVNSRIIAEARIQGLTLRPVVGAYELLFGLDVAINPATDYPRRVSIIGARVGLRTEGSSALPVGFARPEASFEIRQWPYPNRMTPTLVLALQPGQLAEIERLRDTGDVTFELLVSGVGTDQNGDQSMQDEWRIQVPRSDWLSKLRSAGARNILLLEVPLPLLERPEKWSEVTIYLQRAEKYFRDGDHGACVAACRTVLDELGHHKFGKRDWAAPFLDRLASDRTNMTADAREAALWAAVRHYAHLAHHGGSDGGVSHYTRSEAQLMLTMIASLVRHAQAA